jgi:hypothetical protein
MSRFPRATVHGRKTGPHSSGERRRDGERPTRAALSLFRSFLLLSNTLMFACSASSSGSSGGGAGGADALGREQVARCGDEAIGRSSVIEVAAARHLSARESVELLVGDACLAEGAKRRGLPGQSQRAVEERRVLSRALLTELGRDPGVLAPIRDEELAAIRAQRWRELDHDAAFRVVHAVAMFPEKGPRDADQLRTLIGRVLASVHGAGDAADFRKRALAAVEGDPLKKQLRVEVLEPVIPDGRVLAGDDATYDKAFAEAASRLKNTNEISPIVESSFGFHVLMLLEIVPAVHIPEARLREVAAPEIRANRGRAALGSLMERLHAETPTPVVRDADDLLSKVRFGPPELLATPAAPAASP